MKFAIKKFDGWIIKLKPKSTEGYCWQKRKIIDWGLAGTNPFRLLLHEIAHIDINPPGNKHNQKWFDKYIALMKEYLPGIDISDSDKIIQKTYDLVGKCLTI